MDHNRLRELNYEIFVVAREMKKRGRVDFRGGYIVYESSELTEELDELFEEYKKIKCQQ